MPRYRVCKAITVESGHMLSRHPDRCRHPHGHTRRVEVVASCEALDENDMVVDFKALKLAVAGRIERLDHAMAVNSEDPMRAELERLHPGGVIVFEGHDPTTEVMAKDIFDFVAGILARGFAAGPYTIPAGRVKVESVRVWETPDSWAEFTV